jgi:hypothetical protein
VRNRNPPICDFFQKPKSRILLRAANELERNEVIIGGSSLRHGSLTGAASGLASKAKGTHRGCGDRHVRLPPFSRVDRIVIQAAS